MVTSVAHVGSAGVDASETVRLMYTDIEYDYKPQNETGALGGEVRFGFDIKATEAR